jgi:excisionase family DNA binding protein
VTRILTVGEVARIADVTPETVRAWCDTGRLPHQRTPGGTRQRLVDELDLQAFLQARAKPVSSAQEPRS